MAEYGQVLPVQKSRLSISFIVGTLSFLIVIGTMVGLYFYRETVFSKFFTTEIENLRKTLLDKCESEKTTLQNGANDILNSKIAEKDKEISDLKASLDAQLKAGKISQDAAAQQFNDKIHTLHIF